MWTPLFISLAFAVTATACSMGSPPPCPEGTNQFVQYELFMGRSDHSGEVVDDDAWDAFLRDTITPRFPDGLTVLDALGQWRNSEGLVQKERSKLLIIKERSKLLIIIVSPHPDNSHSISEISEVYKRRFGQESVLQVVSNTCVSFS